MGRQDSPIYIFIKSGSRVQIVGPAKPYLGQKCVTVRRVDTGKEMVAPESALEPEKPADADDPSDGQALCVKALAALREKLS